MKGTDIYLAFELLLESNNVSITFIAFIVSLDSNFL